MVEIDPEILLPEQGRYCVEIAQDGFGTLSTTVEVEDGLPSLRLGERVSLLSDFAVGVHFEKKM